MTSRTLPLIALGASLLATAGCHHKQKGPQGVKVGLSLADGSTPYDQAIRSAAQKDAEKRGFELHVEDAQGKASEQVRAIEQFVQDRVNVVLVRPIEPDKGKPALQSAADAKVFAVSIDQPVPGATVSTVVRCNAPLSGQVAADLLRDRLPGGGKVALLGSGTPQEKEMIAAFRAYLKQKAPKVQVAAEKAVKPDADAKSEVSTFVSAHGDLAAIFCLNDTLGAVAADALGTGKKTLLISYGGSLAMVDRVKAGGAPALELAVIPERLGDRAARMAWRIVSNKPTPGKMELPPVPIVKENAGNFAAWEKETPANLEMPWKSDLVLELKRED